LWSIIFLPSFLREKFFLYDKSVNQSFGGGSYDGSKSPKRTHSYKLGDDRPGTAKDKTVESLKVGGKSYQRPGTAPSGGTGVYVPRWLFASVNLLIVSY
jgi:hypothetical protein